jgi:antitoxin (DNA-binding transcriptional repressor) of toxin-antitoxin stability system
MNETVEIPELRQNLSFTLRRVAEGERLVVTDRDGPVAELGPPPPTGSRLDQLIAEGIVKPPKHRGRLPEPLKMGQDPEAATRALEAVRGYR